MDLRTPPLVAKLGMGASRFGALGGVSARPGPSMAEGFAMTALAAAAGVRLIDTSGDAIESERMLGQVVPTDPEFDIVTKTGHLDQGVEAVLHHARSSLRRLRVERARAILVRPAALLHDPEGPRLWAGLRKLQDQGLFEAVGISACVCDDPVGLARRYRPDLIQLPVSLLDRRLITSGALAELRAMGIELHLRSAFLHGLLFHASPSAEAPQISRLRRLLAEAGADPMQAALAFVLNRPEAAKVVVGLNSPLELRAVLAAARAPAPQLDWAALELEAPPCQPVAHRRCAA